MRDSEGFRIADVEVRAGETDVSLKVSESYTGDDVTLPLRVIHSRRPGPVVFVSAAIHGNEINGTGIIRELMSLNVQAGTVILVPVANPYGFETHNRYLPDGRDLNRHFPGSKRGSLASRVAHILFKEIVRKSHYGLDLHTGASQRTNHPNVRGGPVKPGRTRPGPGIRQRSDRRQQGAHGVASARGDGGGTSHDCP